MKIAGGVESVFTGSAQEVPFGTSSISFSILLSLISLSLSLFSISGVTMFAVCSPCVTFYE